MKSKRLRRLDLNYRNKVKKTIALIVAIILVITGIVVLLSHKNDIKVSHADTLYSNYKKLSASEKEEKVNDTSYILECSYEGENVPYYLFDEAFQKSEDITSEDGEVVSSAYVANKDIDMTDEEYQLYEEALRTHVDTIFNMSYKDILKDQDVFAKNYTDSLAYDGNDIQEDIYDIEEFYVDNKATTTADVSTAKCLFYEDTGMYILRSSIDIRIAGSENVDKAFYNTFNIKLNDGAATVMAEAYFFKDGSHKITAFTMNNIEDKEE